MARMVSLGLGNKSSKDLEPDKGRGKALLSIAYTRRKSYFGTSRS
jgi:hypothetical protein